MSNSEYVNMDAYCLKSFGLNSINESPDDSLLSEEQKCPENLGSGRHPVHIEAVINLRKADIAREVARPLLIQPAQVDDQTHELALIPVIEEQMIHDENDSNSVNEDNSD